MCWFVKKKKKTEKYFTSILLITGSAASAVIYAKVLWSRDQIMLTVQTAGPVSPRITESSDLSYTSSNYWYVLAICVCVCVGGEQGSKWSPSLPLCTDTHTHIPTLRGWRMLKPSLSKEKEVEDVKSTETRTLVLHFIFITIFYNYLRKQQETPWSQGKKGRNTTDLWRLYLSVLQPMSSVSLWAYFTWRSSSTIQVKRFSTVNKHAALWLTVNNSPPPFNPTVWSSPTVSLF